MKKFSVIAILMIMLLSIASMASAKALEGTSPPYYLSGNISYEASYYNRNFVTWGSVTLTLLKVTPTGDVPVGSQVVFVRPGETKREKVLLASNQPADYYKLKITYNSADVAVYADRFITE
ncbi:hypothetical protein PAE9249_04958 [Paenibacillus sp. CECT 9249]|uniref:hypothetical protein n=1 Tax=Paenibacillus sp. CECT 9249 TaxID=2845385 RepID=UPI001E6546ED|nr:hypothetical protein [Paenibacillus sp. CECT 9249]CAH0122408.1 hypothetical protein PAE9249_04958 [Paenibacillus sp. CECT 9249]